jgi:YhcH/YjgK/YiaL family protein
MIIDQISHASLYHALGPGVRKALEYLAHQDFSRMKPGRYDVDGQNCFALVSDYDTQPREEKKWEAHRRYIDVQYLANGSELIGYAPMESMRSPGEYDEAKDMTRPEGEGSFLQAGPGTFVILFPHDVHMPGVAVSRPGRVRKIVVKVKMA